MGKNIKGSKNFFAAANSGYGFYSFYDDIFEDRAITDRYIIKGGPGTGKSRFMKEIAYRATNKGMPVECFSCSSDPSSLDSVIALRDDGTKLCILDGTAPHICEASLPGARDCILNFGEFWDSNSLRKEREHIISLNCEKSKAYHASSDCLRSMLLVRREYTKAAREATDRTKISAAVKRFLSPSDASDVYSEHIGIASSFGMFGRFVLDTYSSAADDVVIIDDSYGNASVLLDALLAYARANGISSYRSYDFLDPHSLDALFFCDLGISFVSSALITGEPSENVKKNISMQRFTDKAQRRTLKMTAKRIDGVSSELNKKALYDMEIMRNAHFELERIYTSAMDFPKKEKFTEKWVSENI